MRKLRWVMDGGGAYDLDVSTSNTLQGLARPVPGNGGGSLLPLGLSRGVRLSRPKQVDFFHRFMFMPFVPSSSPSHGGFSLQRLLSFPIATDHWFGTVLAQFNLQKFVSSLRNNNGFSQPSSDSSSWVQSLCRHLSDKSLYALDFCSELFLTPNDTLLLSSESWGADDTKTPRKKAVLHHKFPNHNLTLEAASPTLFVDADGTYWDVPLTMTFDLASVASDDGASYHVCINHNSGSPQQSKGHQSSEMAAALLPGFCVTSAFSFKKNVDLWRSQTPKLKMVQPYDIFLSNPHISASGIIGAVMTVSLGDNSLRAQATADSSVFGSNDFRLRFRAANSAIIADSFASVSLSAQYGNFQRLFLDLTRFQARLEFPSGSTFLSGTTRLANDLYNSQIPSLEAMEAICPSATISFQQQVAGPFSLRVDSGVALNLRNGNRCISVRDPVFAVEYALQVLGSAKAVAWYSPKQREFMMELRFFET